MNSFKLIPRNYKCLSGPQLWFMRYQYEVKVFLHEIRSPTYLFQFI